MITTALVLRPPLHISTIAQRISPNKISRTRKFLSCTSRLSSDNRRRDVHQAKQEAFWINVGKLQAILLRLLPSIVSAVFLSLASRFLPWGCSSTPSSLHGCYNVAPRLPQSLAVDASSLDRPQCGFGRPRFFPTFNAGCSIPFASAGLSRAEAAEQHKLRDWIEGVRVEALERGVSPATAERALAGIQPLKRVMQRETSQPEKALSLQAYVDRTVTEFTVKRGLEAYYAHEVLLTKVEERFGVPRSVLVALWGVESSFGRNCGNFDCIQAILTLAYHCDQLAPDGVQGKAYLVGPNFRALLKYNNSISYAVTVATLAGVIEGRLATAAGEVPL